MSEKKIVMKKVFNKTSSNFVVSAGILRQNGVLSLPIEEANDLIKKYPNQITELPKEEGEKPAPRARLGDKKIVIAPKTPIVSKKEKTDKKDNSKNGNKDSKKTDDKKPQELEKLIADAKELGIENPEKLSEGELLNAIDAKLNAEEK